MKKRIAVAFLVLILVATGAVVLKPKFGHKPVPTATATPTSSQIPEVITLKAEKKDETPFFLLIPYVEKNGWYLKTKDYDFGILIEAIGDKANSPDRAWIYFVNGVSGDVAADRKYLKEGDIVEWKYIKPEF